MERKAYVCPRCRDEGGDGDPGILDVRYDYAAAARRWASASPARPDLFRYLPLLPVEAPGEVLPAGGTPLVPAPELARRLGLGSLWLKDETRNPTRCLKDRATAVAVTLAEAEGASDLYCSSQGNAGISLAAFCAHRGLGCHVFVSDTLPPARLRALARFGADVRPCPGGYDRAHSRAEEVGQAAGWYSRNCALNPFLVEGKKTVAFEIAEQLGRAPRMVVAPVGDGCTLGAIGKGFRELREMGRIDRLPRLLGVQAEAVAPLVARLRGEAAPADGGAAGDTRATSIAVRRPRNARRLLREIGASGGTLVAVSDEETAAAKERLSREAGVAVEFSSATTLAGLASLAGGGELEGEEAVLVLTGGRLDEGD